MKIVGAIFEKVRILNFFLGELPLILRVDRKRRNELEIFARGPQISNVNELGQLVQVLRQGTDRKLKTIFLASRIFPGKTDTLILLGFEYTIKPQNLIKIVGAIFEKIIILNFFSCKLPLILELGEKKRLEIFTRGPQISILNEISKLIQARRSATVRQKNTHIFSKSHFQTVGVMQNKKSLKN